MEKKLFFRFRGQAAPPLCPLLNEFVLILPCSISFKRTKWNATYLAIAPPQIAQKIEFESPLGPRGDNSASECVRCSQETCPRSLPSYDDSWKD